ncbi:MAG: hypothetical protein R3C51_01410 [Parvularculaceae bacterium]
MAGRFFTACVAAVAACAPANASPWNRDDGGIFLASTANYYFSDPPQSKYTRIDSDTYLELGLTDNWMASGRVSYGVSITDTAAGSFTDNGVNEAELSLQRQIQRGQHSATALKISGVRSGALSIDAQSGAPTPNMEIELRALHGRDLIASPVKVFATGEVAYRRRFGGDADQVRADVLVGVEPSRSWLVLLEAQSIISLQNEDPGFADFDLYKGQASIVWRKSRRWSIVVGGRKEFATRNIAPGVAAFIGIWSEF